jgi:hypothetical protein
MLNGKLASDMIILVGMYLRVTNQIDEKERNLSDNEIGKVRYGLDGFYKLHKEAEQYFASNRKMY